MQAEKPTLILSQDYELFFQESGSPERCLFEPCDALLGIADKLGVKITFFVDAGMIVRMNSLALESREVASMGDRIRRHVASLAAAGHEIALHIHPHWEETAWRNGGWDFSSARYALSEFSEADIVRICSKYSACLSDLTGKAPMAYRAGGFCLEPFEKLRGPLADIGICIDSSVVPGARLVDPERGFDFRQAPDQPWWFFADSPLRPMADGPFLEIPVTPQRLGATYYWRRVLGRLRRHGADGAGVSRRPANREILLRLAGLSRVAELSIDEPKVRHLGGQPKSAGQRDVWHLMGHPKLLSRHSLVRLEEFIARERIREFDTASSFAARVERPIPEVPRACAS